MIELYDYQVQVAELLQAGKNIILQAPTGAGKTLASLYPFLEAWDAGNNHFPRKCVYAVPMRVLANQFFEEYHAFINQKMRTPHPPHVLRQTGEYRQDAEFRADLTFATIDQVLSSWLLHPYSLSSRQGNINAGAFVGSYLVCDEFHLFDPDNMLPTTLQMLHTIKGISPFVLMTATFSATMLQKLAHRLDAEAVLLTPDDLHGIGSQQKTRRFHVADEPLVTDGRAQIAPILERHNKRSVVILNQVARAQQVYEALREAGHNAVLLHSRFRTEDRQQIEARVRREFGKDTADHTADSLILVATQVVEVGVDITCTALHTELAPAASVLQRAGRCARYEGETGDVFVYPVETTGPYSGDEAEAQSERTLAWLRDNQDRHLSFADEQALVNHAHGPTDQKLIAQLENQSGRHREEIRNLWRGIGGRAEAKRLIRDIQSVSLVIHDDPDRLLHEPFAAESFSLHPGTLVSQFETWQEATEEMDDDPRKQAPEWTACRLWEDEPDEDANRPTKYAWKKVGLSPELRAASLVVVHPALVGYRPDLGLMLTPGERYTCPIPPEKGRGGWRKFYRLETYEEHIRLVHEAFAADETGFARAARRLEKAYGWRAGLVTEMAHLIVWLHDVGKLARPWQGWAQTWQAKIDQPYTERAIAHTDYDDRIPHHKQMERKLRGRRPNHAVESAVAALPFLVTAVDGDQLDHPLIRAAFSAIGRHHTPFSQQTDGYQLIDTARNEIAATADLLPQTIQAMQTAVLSSGHFMNKVDMAVLQSDFVDNLLVDVTNPADMCAYLLLVRALRHADQAGTKKGAEPDAKIYREYETE